MSSDYAIKLNKRAMSYSNSYMSDAKWRKFFKLFLNKKVELCYKTFWDDDDYEYSLETVRERTIDFIGSKYLKDGVLLSGPLVYKEIIHIDIYKFEECEAVIGNSAPSEKVNLDLFKKSLDKTGHFTVVNFDNYIRVLGYS